MNVMKAIKKLIITALLPVIMLTACKKEQQNDLYVYTGNETPGKIPGFGDCVGVIGGDWYQLPKGVEYAGPIRPASYYEFEDGDNHYSIGDGYHIQVTIPLRNPNNVPIEFPAGMILVPMVGEDLSMEMYRAKSYPMTRAVDCANRSYFQRLGDWFAGWFNNDPCPGKKGETQTGVNARKAAILSGFQSKNSSNTSHASETVFTKASAEPGIQYITIKLYCGNENEGRPNASGLYYPPFVTNSTLLQWFFKMLEGKDISDVDIQHLLWKLTDGDGLTKADIELLKKLPKAE